MVGKIQTRKPMGKRPEKINAFILIWVGQFVSMTGSYMTSFALGIWAWEKTGSAQALALVGVFTYAPLIVMTPLAGMLVDRWNRKWVMMISDLGAVLASMVVFALYTTGNLEIWHIYATTAFASMFQAFQWPAYSAAMTLMVEKEHYSRASGFISMMESGSNIVGPILAGALIGVLGIKGILLIDLATFCFAIVTLLLVVIPQPVFNKARYSLKTFWQDITFGFRFILQRPGLLNLQLIFFGANFMTVFGWAVVNAMVLARTGSNAQVLGFVQSFAAVGGLVGAVFLMIWGGPKKQYLGVLVGWILNGIFGRFLMGISQTPWLWMISAFLLAVFMPTVNGSNQAIWQRKVPPEQQGRVFAVRRFIAQITIPVSLGLSGWLADHVFEPGFATAEAWGSKTLGWLVGTGPGAGLSLMIAISGIMVALVGLVGLLSPSIRNVERDLPDFESGDIEGESVESEIHTPAG
ncbi:MAG: MFS transporter [Anaerolineaceae bacterium]|jgi:MFS family permease|nr:MFS transporter [Anaerolineaceae bacterium]